MKTSIARAAFVFTALAASTLLGMQVAHAQPAFQLESAVKLKSAAPDWDYLSFEPARGYLFIGRRADGVTVYDTRAHRVVRRIADSEDANATTLVPEFDRGYTVNGDGSSTVFRLSTLQTLGRIKLGDDADNAFYEPITRQLAFMMGDSALITFVDARSGAITGRLSTASHKLDGTAPDGQGGLFIAERDRNAVLRVDARTRQVSAEWPIAGCEQPAGLALDSVHQRLFVGCRGKAPVLAVLDTASGALITTQEIGRGNDGVVYDAATRRVITSNGVDGNLVVFEQADPDTYRLLAAVTTRPYARTMAYDAAHQKLYTVTAEGIADPKQAINKSVAPFYPNRYYADTFTLLTYAARPFP
jgi:DNA-binding beta-propeller fold protein YncE